MHADITQKNNLIHTK